MNPNDLQAALAAYRAALAVPEAEYEAAKNAAWQQALDAFDRGECSHPAVEDHHYYDDLIAPARQKYFAARNEAYQAFQAALGAIKQACPK